MIIVVIIIIIIYNWSTKKNPYAKVIGAAVVFHTCFRGKSSSGVRRIIGILTQVFCGHPPVHGALVHRLGHYRFLPNHFFYFTNKSCFRRYALISTPSGQRSFSTLKMEAVCTTENWYRPTTVHEVTS